MKNIIEGIAVFLVLVLSGFILFLVFKYNMIEDTIIADLQITEPLKIVKKKVSSADYLSELEGYEDVDVVVDSTKKDRSNIVRVKSEEADHTLDDAVEDKAKTSYMENLMDYANDDKKDVYTEKDVSEKDNQYINKLEDYKKDTVSGVEKEIEDKFSAGLADVVNDGVPEPEPLKDEEGEEIPEDREDVMGSALDDLDL